MDCVNYFRMVIPKTRQEKSVNNSSTFKVSLTKTTIFVISIILKGDFFPEKKKCTSSQLQPHLPNLDSMKLLGSSGE